MKKLFSTMLVAIAATMTLSSCDDSNEGATSKYAGDEYIGTMSIEYNGSAAGSPQTDVSFYFDNDTYFATVSLAEVCFTKNMSWITSQMPALDIVLPSIPSVVDGSEFSAISVVPQMTDGQSYDTTVIQSVDNVEVTYDDTSDLLEVSFDCTVLIDMGSGSTATTFSVAFSGYRAE